MTYFAILDNNFGDDTQSWVFENPEEFIVAYRAHEVEAAFKAIEAARIAGHYLVGYFAYELGSVIDKSFASHIENYHEALLCFGVFKTKKVLSEAEICAYLAQKYSSYEPFVSDIKIGIDEAHYFDALARIKAYLEAGDNYQVNFTFPSHFKIGGCPHRFYADLRQAQAVKYGAYLNFPNLTVLSRSPELFFTKVDDVIKTHPMKGTARRDLKNKINDEKLKAELIADPKQRAENLMIVDLLRNDLSKIAQNATVKVDALYDVESFRTVHQMVSHISAKIDKDTDVQVILQALFPCGSITGAPKIRTSEIIKELEITPRGIYTGAIGYIFSNNDMGFSVPIRTVVLNEARVGVLNIGSGVVYDSVKKSEFEECFLKGKFLFEHKPNFKLIESFYYCPISGPRHLDLHLARLETSARRLRFPFVLENMLKKLANLFEATDMTSKIRIELNPYGEMMVEALKFENSPQNDPFVIMSDVIMNQNDPILGFKTTSRQIYNHELARAKSLGAMDALFFNAQGHLTEGAIHNVILRFGESYFTPSLDCGVLPGIGREVFLQNHEVNQKSLTKIDLLSADEILLVSSMRGVITVRLNGTAELSFS